MADYNFYANKLMLAPMVRAGRTPLRYGLFPHVNFPFENFPTEFALRHSAYSFTFASDIMRNYFFVDSDSNTLSWC